METGQLLEECGRITFRRVGEDNAFELVGAARGAFGGRFLADTGGLLQHGARGDFERACLLAHQAADHVQVQVRQNHGVVEVHARAIFFKVFEFLRRTDGQVGDAAGATFPNGRGEDAQSKRGNRVTDGGVEKHHTTLRRVKITRREKDEEDKRPRSGSDHHGQSELRGKMENAEGPSGFVASDQCHGDENAEKERADLHQVGRRHIQGLVHADGATDEVSHRDQVKVGPEQTQAGEPRLASNVPDNGAQTLPWLGRGNVDFRARLLRRVVRQFGGLGGSEHTGSRPR